MKTLSAAEGVQFDLTGTGNVGQYGWVGQGDGLLVRDLNQERAALTGDPEIASRVAAEAERWLGKPVLAVNGSFTGTFLKEILA